MTVFLGVFILAGCSSRTELKWNQDEGYRWADITPGFGGKTGFRKLKSSNTGITFENRMSNERIKKNQIFLNGSGVSTGDIDGDGLIDIYFARLEGPNKLYKNLGGFRFSDITEEAGVAHAGYNSTGVIFADVNGNGHLDLLITSLNKKNTLYINDGQGKFDLKEDSGLGESSGATTMTLADINSNGYLDLYITNYKNKSAKDIFGLENLRLDRLTRIEDGSFKLIPPYDQHFVLIPQMEGSPPDLRELGRKDELYLNKGNGVFQKVTNLHERFLSTKGNEAELKPDWGLTAKFHDINQDGLPDLYVSNDFWTPDRVWINQGGGIFKAIDPLAIRNFSFSSMAVDFSDINRDGSIDIFVTEMLSPLHQERMRQRVSIDPIPVRMGDFKNQPQYSRNSLYLNRGDHTFSEISYYSNLAATGWSWATQFLDVDLDGYEDLIITTGFSHDVLDLDTQRQLRQQMSGNHNTIEGYILQFPSLELTNKAIRNNQDLTFTNKSNDWGFLEKDVSHGMALADLDNDGDLDLVINRLNDVAAVFENTTTEPRIAVRLKGARPNTQAIGTQVKLEGGPVTQTKEVVSGGSYLSGSDPLVVFAADKNNENHTLIVTWPNGVQSTIQNVRANRMYEIEEPDKSGVEMIGKEESSPGPSLFEDVSGRLNHRHLEDPFNDFRHQPLLPYKLSQLGPGIAWIDYDGNGNDDLLITSGKGGKLALYENLGGGSFRHVDLDKLTRNTAGDQTTVIGWGEGDHTKIVVGNANYEYLNPNVPSAYLYSIDKNGNVEVDTLPGILSTTGSVAAADYNGDGYVDLFIGGRFKPGQYPRDADSRLFIYENDSFRLDQTNSLKLRDIGLVTGVVFTDSDQDGDQDLLISREWDSIILFENNKGIFQNISAEAGLDSYKGWWNGIATGDFNNDGLPDIIATNIGTNSPYQLDAAPPLKIYYDDFNRDGTLDIIEAFYDPVSNSYVPRRMSNDFGSISSVILRYVRSHKQFANTSLEDILGYDLDRIPNKEINTLEHMIFINTGTGYKAHPLPAESQFTSGFNAGIADFDNDGNEDLFLSQNFLGFPRKNPRLDAGRGLILKGDGNGNFTPVSGSKSGVKVYGEQRGAALGDFNKDGRVDLVVSQNSGVTKLYENKTGKSGLRIQLNGPASNRDAIGSSIRIIYKDETRGPRREIQAGSGYWSQNSSTQVMGLSREPKMIEITWFDGTIQSVNFTRGKINYTAVYPDS